MDRSSVGTGTYFCRFEVAKEPGVAAFAKISPVNSLVFIHGLRGWTSPLPVDGKLVWSTPTCTATACFPEVEGPTEIILGNAQEVDPRGAIAFEGMLETPHYVWSAQAPRYDFSPGGHRVFFEELRRADHREATQAGVKQVAANA
jgi:hypothetical protein